MEDVVRAKRPARLPEVLTVDEVAAVLRLMDGINGLVARLLYGTGMRIMEALRLHVRDLDLGYRQILVRAVKGKAQGRKNDDDLYPRDPARRARGTEPAGWDVRPR